MVRSSREYEFLLPDGSVRYGFVTCGRDMRVLKAMHGAVSARPVPVAAPGVVPGAAAGGGGALPDAGGDPPHCPPASMRPPASMFTDTAKNNSTSSCLGQWLDDLYTDTLALQLCASAQARHAVEGSRDWRGRVRRMNTQRFVPALVRAASGGAS